MQSNAITVSQLNTYVKELFSRDPILRSIRVYGELSGFKRHTSGHLYFTLKDRESQVRCVMFRSAAQTLQFQPEDGMQVLVLAEASVYVQGGQFQLYVQAMQPQGEGELYQQYLLLKAKLEQKGYFAQERKRPIPFLPACVGVITSGTGAALQDILQIIGRRFPAMHVQIYPVQVQGAGASRQIAAAIRHMNAHSSAEVLIVGRGGGSMEDLWAFNEERVAIAMYESRIPIVSAVGHETDFTIADFVADLRAPTPSAAAELCVPEYAQLAQRVDMLTLQLPASFARGLESRREHVYGLLRQRAFALPAHMLMLKAQQVTALHTQLSSAMGEAMHSRRAVLSQLLARLQALSPKAQMKRGYAILSDASGHAVSSVRQLSAGMDITLTLQDGEADATIQACRDAAEKIDSLYKE